MNYPFKMFTIMYHNPAPNYRGTELTVQLTYFLEVEKSDGSLFGSQAAQSG